MRATVLAATLTLFLCTSCAFLEPAPIAFGADPIVVHAERTAEYALATFDSFLLWEHENRAILNNKDVKAAADNIRLNGKGWIENLRTATRAYKVSGGKPDADKLDLALTVVNQALEIARRYLLIKAAQPSN